MRIEKRVEKMLKPK